MKLWLVVGLLLFFGPLQTNQPDVVLDRLAKVEQFAFGPTGYAGVISTGEKDYKIVLSRSSALPDFEKLFAEGDSQAKAYALVGIRKLDPKRFAELARTFQESNESVATMHGCIVSHDTSAHVIKQIESGKS
jgi:hypothetical protein